MFLLAVAIATGAFASEPFIAIADVETGRALVPEGTVVPSGVRFFVTEYSGTIKDWRADADSRGRIPLVFAYAPASKFAEARQVIDATRAAVQPLTLRYVAAPDGTGRRAAENSRVELVPHSAEWIYLYFSDGSYIVALKDIQSNNGVTWYGSGMSVYSNPGTYYTGTIDASVTSNLSPDIYAQYCGSNQCTIGSSGGFCGTPSYYPTSQQAPNPTVYASGSILQRWWGCWTNPNSPCLRYYSGTVEVTFP
ncbi:MAG TPA: hypothetical protein VKB93_18755 [Thermoanaerobaculia bacterium]|nr:hypothetical protein [Thermoanaerobaculia bacterium]